MKDATPQTIYLKDYQVPEYLIEKTELVFELNEDDCKVSSRLHIRRNPNSQSKQTDLFLHGGSELDLQQVAIDGVVLASDRYQRSEEGLVIKQVGDTAVVEIDLFINLI